MKRHGRLGKILSVAILLAAFFSCFSSLTASAVNPTTISFQGKVVNNATGNVGTNVADTTYSIVFKLYTVSSGGAAIWTETQSSVTVTSGVFQVNLGSVCPFFTANACNGNTPIDFNANPNLYLGITFNSDSAGEMSPRVQMQSVPFAYNSDKVGGFSASQLAQLSPSGQQTGSINVSLGGTFGGSLSIGGQTVITSSQILQNVTANTNILTAGLLATARGGTGVDSSAAGNGVLLVGNGSGFTLANLTNNGGITVTNGAGTLGVAVTYGSASSTAVQGNTILTCASGTGNLTGGGTTITLGAGGTCSAISTNAAVSFGTSVTTPLVTSSAGLAVTGGTTLALSSTGANTVTLDTGGAAGLTIAGTNANAVTIGNATSNPNILFSGSGTFGTTSGAVSLNGNTTVAGSKTFNVGTGQTTLGGGLAVTGTFTQTSTSGVTVTSHLNTTTNTNSTSTPSTASSIGIALVGNANANTNANTLNGVNFTNVTALANNTFNALNIGTGYTNFIQTPTLVVTSAGAVSGVTTLTAATINATTTFKANGTTGDAGVTCTGGQTAGITQISLGLVITHAACGGLSDQRLKENIVALNDNVLSQLGQISTVHFNFKCEDPALVAQLGFDCSLQTGVLAQQIATVFPELVTQQPDSYLHVNYQNLGIYTLKGVQQLAQHLDAKGNANLNAVTASNIDLTGDAVVGGNLTVKGTIQYAASSTASGTFTSSIITPALMSSGALAISSGTTGDVTIDTGGANTNIDIGTNNASAVNISRLGQATTINGSLEVNQAGNFHGSVAMDFTGSESLSLTSNLAGDVSGFSFVGTPSATLGNTTGVLIKQAESTNANGLDTALHIDNGNSKLPIGSAINITDTGGAGFTNIIISPNFRVSGTGDVTAKNLHVSLAADGTFALLNPAGSSAMTVDASGNATFSGNLNLSSASLSGGLNVGGDANFTGLSTFQKLATFIGKTIFRQDVQFDAHITVASDTAGYASLRVGESTVHVKFAHSYDNPPVVSASITDGQFALSSVRNITVDGFDIDLQTPAVTATTFSWTALGVNSPQTASNPLPATP